jgi:hypothetical protein
MKHTLTHPLLDTPAKVLIIGITISMIILLFAIPFLHTTVVVCTDGTKFWDNCPNIHLWKDTWTTTIDLNFLNWLVVLNELEFRFIYLIIFCLLTIIISLAYYFIALDSMKPNS